MAKRRVPTASGAGSVALALAIVVLEQTKLIESWWVLGPLSALATILFVYAVVTGWRGRHEWGREPERSAFERHESRSGQVTKWEETRRGQNVAVGQAVEHDTALPITVRKSDGSEWARQRARLSYYRQCWNTLKGEFERLRNRRGDDPDLIAFMHKVVETWGAMREEIGSGSLPPLGAPFDEDLSFDDLKKMQRTKFAALVTTGIENLDHAAGNPTNAPGVPSIEPLPIPTPPDSISAAQFEDAIGALHTLVGEGYAFQGQASAPSGPLPSDAVFEKMRRWYAAPGDMLTPWPEHIERLNESVREPFWSATAIEHRRNVLLGIMQALSHRIGR